MMAPGGALERVIQLSAGWKRFDTLSDTSGRGLWKDLVNSAFQRGPIPGHGEVAALLLHSLAHSA